MLEVPEHFQKTLSELPETGMGFQTGKVTLKDGTEYDRVIIINGNEIVLVSGYEDIPFRADDIASIDLTHERW